MPLSPTSVLFRFSPLARRFLPKWLLRFLLLRVLQTNRRYADIYGEPSRLLMEHELLPWIAQRYARILFVGTSSYTYHYERLFRPGQYTTIEVQPNMAVWGGPDHIVAPIEEIGRHRPDGHFDCIVLNGIFGFGTDQPEHMRVVVEALYRAMQPNGLLVVGWNTDKCADPAPLLEPYFAPNTQEPWGRRRIYPLPETHIYDFLLRRP